MARGVPSHDINMTGAIIFYDQKQKTGAAQPPPLKIVLSPPTLVQLEETVES